MEIRYTCIQKRNVGVYSSGAGYYIGTFDDDGPYCRMSMDYYKTRDAAQKALDNRTYRERDCGENDMCNRCLGCRVSVKEE